MHFEAGLPAADRLVRTPSRSSRTSGWANLARTIPYTALGARRNFTAFPILPRPARAPRSKEAASLAAKGPPGKSGMREEARRFMGTSNNPRFSVNPAVQR